MTNKTLKAVAIAAEPQEAKDSVKRDVGKE